MDTNPEKLDSIDHVAITVADIDQAIKWYQTSFSCKLIQKTQREALLQFSNITLTLSLPSHQKAHLAFEREDAGTLGELRPQLDGRKSCFVADTSGNLIELIKPA